MSLPRAFIDRPIAHRAYHDSAAGRPENSVEAIEAAVAAGYGIEIDVQLTADGEALVFHDHDLDRLTDATGPVRSRPAEELGQLTLRGGPSGPPTLAAVLHLVAGRVPLLVEIKDQDGALGDGIGPLEAAVAHALEGYPGPAAVMSFNPHSVAEMARLLPDVPRGLITAPFEAHDWPHVPEDVRARLREIPDYARTGACFVSHQARDLDRPRVAELKDQGAAILCWTIRSPEAERAARRIADNITFEGYAA